MRLFSSLFVLLAAELVKENHSVSDVLKCATNIEPLVLEDCTGRTPYCYTIAYSDNLKTRYGCASEKTRIESPIECYDNFKPVCPETAQYIFHAVTCCCNSSKCNVYQENGAAYNEDYNEESANNTDQGFKSLNQREKGAVSESQKSWGIIVGVTSGIAFIACLIGAAAIVSMYVLRRGTPNDILNSNDGTKEHTSDSDSTDMPGMVCAPGMKASVNVVHADKTDTIVPSQLTSQEIQRLIKSLKSSSKLRSITKGKKSPTIVKVITYATSDDITSAESSVFKAVPQLSTTSAEDLLERLIRNGPTQFAFSYFELRDLLDKGEQLFLKEPTLLEVPIPCVVYGDIHGQYSDLHRWFNLNGWPSQTRSVFLGDFVDRGTHGVEVIALLVSLKVRFPSNIFLCRGNHEDESLNRAYSFHAEVCRRFPSVLDGQGGAELYTHFKKMFNNMPLAVLIGGRILGMHGGISSRLTSLQAIKDIRRPLTDFEVGSLACDLVWSDPDIIPHHTGFRSNLEREPNYGIGQLFAADTVPKLCEQLGIDMIIRGHQAPLYGYALFSGCLLTLFSAPGYKGFGKSEINMGASLAISANMNITIRQIQVTEGFRHKRIEDAVRARTLKKLSSKSSISSNDILSLQLS